MCGIIACVNSINSFEHVFEGLKKLEYRGYDSWGIASKSKNKLDIIKKVGSIEKVKLAKFPKSNIVIGHTRWCTHGKVSKENAHPQISNDKKIAVVHNGIIENFQELKKFLKNNNFKFKSETDTELIPNLIQYYYEKENNFLIAFEKTLKKIKGSYAIVAIENSLNKIYFAKKESPLVIGIRKNKLNKNEFFISSDINAFSKYTNKVIYLEENDYGHVNSKIEIFNSEKKVRRKVITVDSKISNITKNNFKYYMLKEINDQGKVLNNALNQDDLVLNGIVKRIKNSKNIFLVGAGSSYNTCLSACYIFSKNTKCNVIPILASEYERFEMLFNSESTLIAVSQSGETADLLEVVKIAKEKKVKIASIVNIKNSTLTRFSDFVLLTNTGPEICVASTKANTAQNILLQLIASKLSNGKKKLSELKLITTSIECLIKNSEKNIKKIAGKIKDSKSCFVIGRNYLFPVALEGALKIKEVSYIHTEGFAGGELKHGTIALIEKNTPIIVLISKENQQEIISNAMEVKSRGARVIGIGLENNTIFDEFIKVNTQNQISYLIVLQLLAYYLAIKRGNNPDKPKNLAKAVTVK